MLGQESFINMSDDWRSSVFSSSTVLSDGGRFLRRSWWKSIELITLIKAGCDMSWKPFHNHLDERLQLFVLKSESLTARWLSLYAGLLAIQWHFRYMSTIQSSTRTVNSQLSAGGSSVWSLNIALWNNEYL